MPAQSRVKRIRASHVVISVYSASVILASPARRGKHCLLIYRSPDQGYANTFHAKNARLAARAQRWATPRLGYIGTWSRQHTPPHVTTIGSSYSFRTISFLNFTSIYLLLFQ